MSYRQYADAVRSRGRDEDTMLIHMTPGEVGGLQALALAHGGSLTINPDTGLPEAGFLKKLLPMIAGAGLMMIPGVNALAAAAMVGGGSTALGLAKGKGLSDALGSGLRAGLGAYGGASLGRAAGLGVANAGSGAASSSLAGAGPLQSAATAPIEAMKSYSPSLTSAAAPPLRSAASIMPTEAMKAAVPAQLTAQTAQEIAKPGIFARFADASRQSVPSGLQRIAPYAAGAGLLYGASNALQPRMGAFPGQEEEEPFGGPYLPQPRQVQFPVGRDPADTSEFSYFSPSNPFPGYRTMASGGLVSFADGGLASLAASGGVLLEDGSFVVDARTVSEIGNGSSEAGQEILAQLGGEPVKGPGDGVSDSVPATIAGGQEARVARDEVVFRPEAVAQIGEGDPKRGADMLYMLMERAHEARKNADRGEDTGIAKGLAAI